MKVYLHSDRAEKAARYVVTIAPAGDLEFVGNDVPDAWKNRDNRPKQFEVSFSYGVADLPEDLGRYMVARGIAQSNRVLRKIRQLFDRHGTPIDAVFDEAGNRIFLEGQQ